jgi:Na+-driven multidrug efflux pump
LYPVNIPLAWYLGFYLEFGVIGLWYSQLVSVVLIAIAYVYIVITVDFDEISANAVQSFKKEDQLITVLKHKFV